MKNKEIVKILNKKVRSFNSGYEVIDNGSDLTLHDKESHEFLAWFRRYDVNAFKLGFSTSDIKRDIECGEDIAEKIGIIVYFYNEASDMLKNEQKFYVRVAGEAVGEGNYLRRYRNHTNHDSYGFGKMCNDSIVSCKLTKREIENLPSTFGIMYRNGCFELEEVIDE